MSGLAIVRFHCDTCGDREVPTSDVWLLRGAEDRYAVICKVCGHLKSGALQPPETVELIEADVATIGSAEYQLLVDLDTDRI